MLLNAISPLVEIVPADPVGLTGLPSLRQRRATRRQQRDFFRPVGYALSGFVDDRFPDNS